MAIVGRDVRATGSRCLAPSSGSLLALARSWAKESSSNAPRIRLTVISRRTSRCARRRPWGGRRASSPRSTPTRSQLSTRSRPQRWPDRGSSICAWPTRSSSRRWRRSGRATAAAGPTRPSASRWRWSLRTRPARSSSPRPETGRTATALRACSSSGAMTWRASTTTTTRGLRWIASASRSPPSGAVSRCRKTGIRARMSKSSLGRKATRCRRCSRRSSTRWSASASTSTAGCCRASSSSASMDCCRSSTPTRRTARSGRARRRTGTNRTGC